MQRKLIRGYHVEGGACTEVQPLGVKEIIHHRNRLLVGDMECTIELVNKRPQVLRDASLADAFVPQQCI